MDEKEKAEVTLLLARWAALKVKMASELAECVLHKREHGTFPEDMGPRFRKLAEDGQKLQARMHELRTKYEKQRQDPFHGIEVPNFLPDQL